MNPEDSFTEQSEQLYKKLEAEGVEIDLALDPAAETWYVQRRYSFKIGSPDGIPNKPAMAHELLHIQLTLYGFEDVANIYRYLNEKNSLFDLQFLGHLNNSLAHFKMIDDFIAMGFSVDEFLQDTPKKYFFDNILLSIVAMVLDHKTGTAKICDQTKAIINFCTSAKLFNLYKLKDSNTKNGLAEEAILEELKIINKPLVEGLNDILDWWIKENTIHNLKFFGDLNSLLKQLNIPNAVDCP
jgi:hypothetical protein